MTADEEQRNDHTDDSVPQQTAAEDWLASAVKRGEITRVMLAVPDMQGRLKGKIFDARVLAERLGYEAEMCAYTLATDVDMTPADGFKLTSWDQGFGDLRVKGDRASVRTLPYQVGTALMIGDVFHHDGTPVDVAPRHMLRRQLQHLADHGFRLAVGIESEFLLVKGTPDTLHRSGYRDLRPAWPHNLDYALAHPPNAGAFLRDLHDDLRLAGIPVEAIKTEGAPGQLEVTFAYGDPLAACDACPAYRLIVDDLAQRQGMTAVWMAAPSNDVGSGLHLHLSLWTGNANVFACDRHENLPPPMERAIAGLISGMPHLAPLYAPTTNSYKRYRPHSFAPTRHTWGFDNRGCAVRVTGTGEGTHLEARWAGADANPYLALAAACASITHGFDDNPELPPPCTSDPYTAHAVPTPGDLVEALAHFTGSTFPQTAFGKRIVDHYTRATRIEIGHLRSQVTDTERRRALGRT